MLQHIVTDWTYIDEKAPNIIIGMAFSLLVDDEENKLVVIQTF